MRWAERALPVAGYSGVAFRLRCSRSGARAPLRRTALACRGSHRSSMCYGPPAAPVASQPTNGHL